MKYPFPDESALQVMGDYEKIFASEHQRVQCPCGFYFFAPIWGQLNANTEVCPIGLIRGSCGGFLHSWERGVFILGQSRYRYFRDGWILKIMDKQEVLGEIEYGKMLRFAYTAGNAKVCFRGNLLATLKIPMFCWSPNQKKNITGTIKWNEKWREYLVFAGRGERDDFDYLSKHVFQDSSAFTARPKPNSTPVFPFWPNEDIQKLDGEAKLLLLFSILWSKMFCV